MRLVSKPALFLEKLWLRRLRNSAVALLAVFALLPARAHANEELRALGEYLSTECVTCHQLSGAHDGIPSIVGWDAESFQIVMNEYRDKTRANPAMRMIASSLSEQDVKALALYFGSLEPKNN